MFVSITAILLLDSMNLLAMEDSKNVGKQQEFTSQAQIGRKNHSKSLGFLWTDYRC